MSTCQHCGSKIRAAKYNNFVPGQYCYSHDPEILKKNNERLNKLYAESAVYRAERIEKAKKRYHDLKKQ